MSYRREITELWAHRYTALLRMQKGLETVCQIGLFVKQRPLYNNGKNNKNSCHHIAGRGIDYIDRNWKIPMPFSCNQGSNYTFMLKRVSTLQEVDFVLRERSQYQCRNMLQIRRDIKYPKSKTPERYRIKAKPCKLIMDCIALSSGPSPENRENSVVVEPSGAAEKCKDIRQIRK